MPARKRPSLPRLKLRMARTTLKLSQKELGRLTRCTQATIGDIESGRNHQPSHEKVVRIVRALRAHGLPDVSVDDLFSVPDIPVARRQVVRKVRA